MGASRKSVAVIRKGRSCGRQVSGTLKHPQVYSTLSLLQWIKVCLRQRSENITAWVQKWSKFRQSFCNFRVFGVHQEWFKEPINVIFNLAIFICGFIMIVIPLCCVLNECKFMQRGPLTMISDLKSNIRSESRLIIHISNLLTIVNFQWLCNHDTTYREYTHDKRLYDNC